MRSVTSKVLLALGASVLASGCAASTNGSDTGSGDIPPPLDPSVCDPANGPFSLVIDNPFHPVVVGASWVLEGKDGTNTVRLAWTVPDATEAVEGVATRVVEERQSVNGALSAVLRHFFAMAPDGTVCTFGRDADVYTGDAVTSHEGTWRAGGPNHPGIRMPAAPGLGDTWAIEDAPEVARMHAAVTGEGVAVTLPAGSFTDTLVTSEWTPLKAGRTARIYARGVGPIVQGTLQRLAK
jgi:hypothetical protein